MASSARTGTRRGLAVLLVITGVIHLSAPNVFESIVPSWSGDARTVVYVSGVAELLGASLLACGRLQAWAGWYTVVLFVAVFPANVTMAVREPSNPLAWARLPLQIPLVYWAVQVARAGRRAGHVPQI